ncbi:MAG: hypothetical protein AAFU38_19850 [Bacteroidota bacterium]
MIPTVYQSKPRYEARRRADDCEAAGFQLHDAARKLGQALRGAEDHAEEASNVAAYARTVASAAAKLATSLDVLEKALAGDALADDNTETPL